MIRPLSPLEADDVGRTLGLARLLQGDGEYLVAWEGTMPIGHVHVTHTTPPELQDLEVHGAYRRRGIATSLLDAAEAACTARGDRRVLVEVSVDNPAARALYALRGYVDAGVAPRRVVGTVQVRTGPIEVDDTLLTLVKTLEGP